MAAPAGFTSRWISPRGSRIQRRAHLTKQRKCHRGFEGRLAPEELCQIDPVHIPHRDVQGPLELPRVIHRDDVRMLDRRRRPRLPQNRLRHWSLCTQLGRQHLQCNIASEMKRGSRGIRRPYPHAQSRRPGDTRRPESRCGRQRPQANSIPTSADRVGMRVWATIGPRDRAPAPRIPCRADVAQLVERRLPKPKVAGSRPVVRFPRIASNGGRFGASGGVYSLSSDARFTPIWRDLASSRARIRSSESRARCP